MSLLKLIYHRMRALIGCRIISPNYDFPAFAPASDATVSFLNKLTLDCIAELPDTYLELAKGNSKVAWSSIADFDDQSNEVTKSLKDNFDKYGSDKGSDHQYYKVYSSRLDKTKKINLLEVGIGTNNVKIVSNMGKNGCPGASLRAFRDTYKNMNVFAGDVDKDILFKDDRIDTFYFNQLDLEQMEACLASLPDFECVIDDGLHSPIANLTMFRAAWPSLIERGCYIIEDVRSESIGILLAGLLCFDDIATIEVIECSRLNMIVVTKH